MGHLRVCLEIAAKAAAEDKRYSLAIIYDELCRKEWHQRANRGAYALYMRSQLAFLLYEPLLSGDRGFDVCDVCLEKDREILDRARTVYKEAQKTGKASGTLSPVFPTSLGKLTETKFRFRSCLRLYVFCQAAIPRRLRAGSRKRSQVTQVASPVERPQQVSASARGTRATARASLAVRVGMATVHGTTTSVGEI